MTLIRFCAIIFGLSFITACSALDSSQTTPSRGKNIETVIKRLGQPNQKIVLPNGHTQYVYLSLPRNTFTTPPATTVIALPHGKAIGVVIPTQPPTEQWAHCSRVFETDKQNRIVDARIRGACGAEIGGS